MQFRNRCGHRHPNGQHARTRRPTAFRAAGRAQRHRVRQDHLASLLEQVNAMNLPCARSARLKEKSRGIQSMPMTCLTSCRLRRAMERALLAPCCNTSSTHCGLSRSSRIRSPIGPTVSCTSFWCRAPCAVCCVRQRGCGAKPSHTAGVWYHEVRRQSVLEVGHLGVGVLVAQRLDRAVGQRREDAQQIGQL